MQAKLMEMAALSKLIGNIGKQRVAFDVAVQSALVEVIGQSIVHRNATPAKQLLEVIGAHLKPVVVAFMEQHGNLAYSKADKTMKFYEQLEQVDGSWQPKLAWTDEYRIKVESTAWTKAKKEIEPVSVFDVADEVEKLIDRLRKAAKKGSELKSKGLLEKVEQAYHSFRGAQYLASATALPTAEDVEAAGASADKLKELQEKFGGRPTAVKAA